MFFSLYSHQVYANDDTLALSNKLFTAQLLAEPSTYYAGNNIHIITKLTNNLPVQIMFSGYTFIGGTWWGGGIDSFILPSGTKYYMECNATGCKIYWSGIISKFTTLTLDVPVNTNSNWVGIYSKATTAEYKLVHKNFSLSADVIALPKPTLTPTPTFTPSPTPTPTPSL